MILWVGRGGELVQYAYPTHAWVLVVMAQSVLLQHQVVVVVELTTGMVRFVTRIRVHLVLVILGLSTGQDESFAHELQRRQEALLFHHLPVMLVQLP